MKPLEMFFSVIIPSFNRFEQLVDCLQAIAKLDYPRDSFEVIVVDDGSQRPLDEVVTPFMQKINLTLIRQENAGPGIARNAGAKHAKGDYLVFTDDDCTPAFDWLTVFAKYIKSRPSCIVGGRTKNQLPNNLFSTTTQLIIDIIYRRFNADADHAHFFASNNMVISRKDFLEIGGFNARFRTAEDRELCDRWRHRGYRLVYAEDAVVYHAHHLDLFSFCRQHYEYGRGAFNYHQLRAKRGSGNMFEDIKLHLNVGSWLFYPFKKENFKKAFPLAGALLLWQLLNAAGFYYESFANKQKT